MTIKKTNFINLIKDTYYNKNKDSWNMLVPYIKLILLPSEMLLSDEMIVFIDNNHVSNDIVFQVKIKDYNIILDKYNLRIPVDNLISPHKIKIRRLKERIKYYKHWIKYFKSFKVYWNNPEHYHTMIIQFEGYIYLLEKELLATRKLKHD